MDKKEKYYIDLFTRFCKAHPKFFVEPYFKFNIIPDRSKTKMIKRLTTYVNKGRVNYLGKEDHDYDVNTSDGECCKELLTSMMKNKSFQDYFNILRYDSFEELDIKLTLAGQ